VGAEFVLALVLAAPLLAGGFAAAAAAHDAADSQGRRVAAVRIELPQGVDPRVLVWSDAGLLVLELPAGARPPEDLESASGGLLRGARVIPLGEDRMRLEIPMALGALDHVEYTPREVTLFLDSRFDQAPSVDEAVDEYRLGPGDKLLLTVHNQPELTSHLTLTDEGLITAPLVGDVNAGGLTVRELATRLAGLLDRTYLVSPKVDVQVEVYRSQWAMVSGEVRTPGRVPLRGRTQLKEVLSEAGGFGEHAGEEILISRRVNGAPEPLTIRLDRQSFESGLENPVLRHGDIVTVKRAEFCYVHGEVKSAGRVAIEPGMTLLRAITIVGGLTEWANKKAVQVLRQGEQGPGRVYNLKAIQDGRAPDPPLSGGDIVVVRRRAL
jgi:polysaccharide export outer membrane protein